MNSDQDFRTFYDLQLLPGLQPLEIRRKTALKKIILLIVIMVAAMMTALAVLGSRGAPGPVVLAVFFGGIAVIIAGIRLLRFDVAGEFKRVAVAKLVALLDSGLSYDPGGSIERDVFTASGIFPGRFRFYHGSDLVSGKAGRAAYAFSYLLVSRTRPDTRRRRSAPVFQGLFLVSDGNRTVRGVTVVRPKRTDLKAAAFLQTKLRSFFGSGGEEVGFDDPSFSGLFWVQSTEPGEARIIITPEMRQRITALGQRPASRMYLAFAGQKVYAALSCDRELFGAHLTRTVLDRDSIEADLEALRMTAGLAGSLGLG